MATRK